jgi:hypothetical protein
MILRNTAGQPILIGPLLAVADGVTQTSGAAIAVRKDGVDVGAAGGTLAHVSDGVWQYIPSQGETDCGIIGLILTKAAAIAVPLNILTTRLPVQTTGAVPAVAAGSAGGMLIVGTGTGAINPSGGKVPATVAAGDIAANAMTASVLAADAASEIAAAVELAILNEADLSAVLEAIRLKIETSDDDLTVGLIAAQVRVELATELARLDVAVGTRLATAGYSAPDNAAIAAIKAKTDLIPAGGPLAASSYTAPPTVSEILTAIRTYVPTFRDQSALAEGSITVEDCWAAGWVDCAGDEAVVGTAYTKKRATGAAFRTFALDSSSVPTSRT